MFRANLRIFVKAAFAARQDPVNGGRLDRIRSRGWDRCPRCGMRLGLDGYRRTETKFMSEEVLVCFRCGARHVLTSHVIH